MRRTTARSYGDADDHRDNNLSPRGQLDGDHLGPGSGMDPRNWNDDGIFGDHVGGADSSSNGAHVPLLAVSGMEAGDNGKASGGGNGGGGLSPRDRSLSRAMGGGVGGGGGGGGNGGSGIGGGGGGGGGGSGIAVGSGGYHTSSRKRRRGERRFFLRIHKFVFQKELAMHFSMCILSIAIPFSLSGSPWLAAIPLSVWCFYNAMFVMGAKRAGAVLPGFDRFKRSFVAAMEEFLPPRLVPVLSLSFLSVIIAVTLTAARLRGPPLCVSSCGACLGSWKNAQSLAPASEGGKGSGSGGWPSLTDAAVSKTEEKSSADTTPSPIIVGFPKGGDEGGGGSGSDSEVDAGGLGTTAKTGRGDLLRPKDAQACGYSNGKELLAYYTVSQSAILIYLAVMTGLLTCLAWTVSDEELAQREAAESRLKSQNPRAFELRERMILEHGRPGSSVRPETTRSWLMFGLVAACTFTLIGWRKWGDLPPTVVTVIVIGANVTTTLASVLMLHVGFHGRLIALYQGNLQRVQFLSKLLREGTNKPEEPWVHAAEAWWFLRSFVLREDLSLDYDVGGLGVSATFFIVLASFVVAIAQILREGLDAMLNPPGSYCAYASVYLTVCLIRIFGLATKTYVEQQLHVGIIQEYTDTLTSVASKTSSAARRLQKGRGGTPSLHVDTVSSSKTNRSDDSGREDLVPGGLNRSKQNESALAARMAVTGTAAQGMGSRRGNVEGVSVAAEGTPAMGPGGIDMDGSGFAESSSMSPEGEDDDGGPLRPAQEAMRRMIVHMSESDPYPCVLGVPVKPALFATSKVYVFVCFAVISIKLMYDVISGLGR